MTVPDYKDLVVQAEKAVASVSDPALKQIAFQKILDDLLSNREGKPQSKTSPKKDAGHAGTKTKTKRGPKAYVEELVDEGFFNSRRAAGDVLKELADRGHHISSTDVAVTLLRLCKSKQLRRKKDEKTYLYSNW